MHHHLENIATFEHLNLDFDTQSCVRVVNNRFAEDTTVENYFAPGLYISMLGKCNCFTNQDIDGQSSDYSYRYIVALVEEDMVSKIRFSRNSLWQTFSIRLPLSQIRDFSLPSINNTSYSNISLDTLTESGVIPSDILHCCESVWQCTFQGMERELFIKAKALEVLSLFLHKRRQKNLEQASPRLNQLNEALNYIQMHLAEDWSLEAVARLAGSNRTYIKQDIKQLKGISFREWLTQARLKAAAELLSGNESIIQIAYKVGFKSQAHFATLFKSVQGVTPSEYRQSISIER